MVTRSLCLLFLLALSASAQTPRIPPPDGTRNCVVLRLFTPGTVSATTATDRSGFGHHGTVVNTGFQPGLRAAMSFTNAANSYVIVQHREALNYSTNAFSVTFWVLFRSIAQNEDGVLSKDSYAGGNNYTGLIINIVEGLAMNFETRNVVGGTGPRHVLKTPTVVPVNQWLHFAMTRTSSGQKSIYQNGVLAVTGNDGVININNASSLCFGLLNVDYNKTSQNLNGQLSDVVFYNRALTADEIKRIYRGVQ